MSTYFIRLASLSAIPRCRGALVPPVGLEPTRSHERHILSVVCLPIPPRRQKKKGAETNARDNHATTVRPTGGTHAHQPHHRPAQPACADTLNRPTQTGPNLLTNTESALAQTPKRHPHTPSAPSNAATHPCVTAPAAASVPVLFCFRSPVGVAGLEPAASSSRTKRATKLRHTPKTEKQTLKHPLFSSVFLLLAPTIAHPHATVKTSEPNVGLEPTASRLQDEHSTS